MTFDDVCAVIVTREENDLVRDIASKLPYGEVVIADNSKLNIDLKCYGRYAAAERSQRPLIYFQDDDVRFENHEDLLANYEPGVLIANMYDEWIESCAYFDIALPGLGSIQDNGLWKRAFKLWDRAQGMLSPDFLSYCDQVYGVLTPYRRYDLGHDILPEASDGTRMWQQEGNFEAKWGAIHQARSLRTVTLAMMVKDEAHQVERALDSAFSRIDSLCVLDTGSTDNTIETVRGWALERGVPCRIYESEFEGYGISRNRLLDLARPMGDYTLMMDADETLIGDEPWPELSQHAYLLHYAGSVDYAQPRLISRNFPFRFDDVRVHAALGQDVDLIATGSNLRTPQIEHHGWDRVSDERIQRDIAVLTEEIEAGNDIPRNLYLRAKAYEGQEMYDDALLDYEALVETGDKDEQTWYARFRLGAILVEHKGLFAEGADQLFQAYLDRPQRIESLRALAHYCTAIADAAPYPEDELLIVFREHYTATT